LAAALAAAHPRDVAAARIASQPSTATWPPDPLDGSFRRMISSALRRAALVLAGAASSLAGQPVRPAAPMPALDSARLLADLSALAADSMEGRRVGTPGGARARAYLMRAFARLGLEPARDSFPMPFVRKWAATADIAGVNLVGRVRGTEHPDRYLVVSAHYDHLGVRKGEVFNGADDNASGTAAVLAIAAWFKSHPPRNSILFAWFDGEEFGLLGAKEFLEHPPVPIDQIVANVNLDMVSRNVKGELYAGGATPWPVMRPLLDGLASVALVTLRQGHDSGVGEDNWLHQSYHGPFHDRGIPFVYFGVEDHVDYHKATDKVEHIPPGFYVRSARTIAEFVRRLDQSLDPVARARAAARGSR
jgi:hypothetical protein